MHLVLVDEQVWTNRYTAEHVRYAAAAWMDMNPVADLDRWCWGGAV